jgi:hypothetical protein
MKRLEYNLNINIDFKFVVESKSLYVVFTTIGLYK